MAAQSRAESTARSTARRIVELEATVSAQATVIATLVAAAEARGESITRLGTQHVVEERVAHVHHAERVLRSVIDSLDGSLCIVGADGAIIDANRQWLTLLRTTHPTGQSAGTARPGPERTGRPGTVGSDFFVWCDTARGMQGLLDETASMVRQVIEAGSTAGAARGATGGRVADPAAFKQRSVKGQVQVGEERRWFIARVHSIRGHATARAVVSLIDISEGMQAQIHLRKITEESQRLALVAKATQNAIVITGPDGVIEWVNESFVRRTGYTLDEAVGRTRLSLTTSVADPHVADSRVDPSPAATNATPGDGFGDFFRAVLEAHHADGEYVLTDRFGWEYWASVEVRPALEDGEVAHLVWVEQDVTARRQAQQRLKEAMMGSERLAAALSHEKTLLAGVISAVPQWVFWKDAQGRYTGCNTAYLELRGRPDAGDLLGRDESVFPRDDGVAEALAGWETEVMTTGGAVLNRTVDLADGVGARRTFLVSMLPLDDDRGARGVIGVGADITHVRELEYQLAQANRLESIGQLAAGIAHEINTPIQYVTDNIDFLAEVSSEILGLAAAAPAHAGEASAGSHPPDGSGQAATFPLPDVEFLSREVPAALSACAEGLNRVTEIVRAMKDYAHPSTGRTDIDVNRALESTVQVCRNEWKYVADMRLDLSPDAGTLPCYEGELKQVILNIIVNAAQAIGEHNEKQARAEGTERQRGQICVATRREPPFLVITIADNGPGMSEDVRRKVFDPFFTTKEVGKGTGQGLSLAHSSVVIKHHGRIDLQTAPGQGARFDLYLPLNAPADTSSVTQAVHDPACDDRPRDDGPRDDRPRDDRPRDDGAVDDRACDDGEKP